MGKGDGLFRRGQRWWIRTDPITGKPISTGSRDKTAALAFRRRRERDAADPAHATTREATFEKWADKLIKLKRATKAAGTVQMYEQKLGHVPRIAGDDFRMADVTPAWVDSYFAQRREEGTGEQTLARELTAIFQVCKLAQRSKEYSGDVKSLRPPGFSPKYVAKERWLPPAELEALLRELPAMKAAHVAFMVGTGARRGEGDRAVPGDIDLVRGVVKLRGTKTRRAAREIPILDVLRPLVEAAVPWLPLGPWNNQLRDLGRACKRADIERVSWNDLRRTTATWLIGAGVSHELVAKILGHATPTMVYRVYGQASAETIGALAEAQIENSARSRQSRAEKTGTLLGPIAQSVELRIFNPQSYAEAVAAAPLSEQQTDALGLPGDAEWLPESDSIVTVSKTPEAEVCGELYALKAMAAELECEAAESAIERALREFAPPDDGVLLAAPGAS